MCINSALVHVNTPLSFITVINPYSLHIYIYIYTFIYIYIYIYIKGFCVVRSNLKEKQCYINHIELETRLECYIANIAW